MNEVAWEDLGVRFVDFRGTRWYIAKDVLVALGVLKQPNARDWLRHLYAAYGHVEVVNVGRKRTQIVSEAGVSALLERWTKKNDPRRRAWKSRLVKDRSVMEAAPNLAPQASPFDQYRSARERLRAQADELRERLGKIEGDLAVLERAAEIVSA